MFLCFSHLYLLGLKLPFSAWLHDVTNSLQTTTHIYTENGCANGMPVLFKTLEGSVE